MLVVETVGRIRREHLVKGKSIKEIARDLKISRNTVRKVLRSGATSFEYEREVQPRPKLGRWSGDLDRLLTLNTTKAARERLTVNRLSILTPGRRPMLTPLSRADDGERSPRRSWSGLRSRGECGGGCQPRCLKRQLSLPVSTMSQWWVRRSRSAVVILASPKTVGHSPKARLVVTMTEVRS